MNYLVEYNKKLECYEVFDMCCFPKAKGLEKPRSMIISEDEMDFIIENSKSWIMFGKNFN